jgi:hypothetical protein
MTLFSIISIATTAIVLVGCVHNPSYDSLGGYYSSSPSYSVGVSYGNYYPAYPVYRGGPYSAHRHHHHHRGHNGHSGHRGHGHNGR